MGSCCDCNESSKGQLTISEWFAASVRHFKLGGVCVEAILYLKECVVRVTELSDV